ncbi:MAG: excinuclease ABC subunit UvrA [Planctomycetota bacterium]
MHKQHEAQDTHEVNGAGPSVAHANGNGRAAIRVRGARTHNLQNVDLDIPHGRLVVVTGLSGSGKSSLAFDTLLAEGQRQYIESLSPYSRQFFDQMERPDVDVVEGLQPTIAIDQSPTSQNPRSTVATVTEIYDFLRVLMARVAQVHCPSCGTPITQQTPAEIQEAIELLPESTKVMILAPMVRGRKGKHAEVMELIRKEGFVRVRIDGQTHEVENAPELSPQKRHDIEAVVDRVIIREGLEGRIAESVRLALKHGDGALRITYLTPEAREAHGNGNGHSTEEYGWENRVYSTLYACPDCKESIEEVEPRTFSFNSPYGACPQCEGLGGREGFDAEVVLPDASLSLAGGALAPWRSATAAATKKNRQRVDDFLQAEGLGWDEPVGSWTGDQQQALLHGDGDGFPGVLAHLEMDYARGSAAATNKLGPFRSIVHCRDCDGTRLKPAARSCLLDGRSISDITALSIEDAASFFKELTVEPAKEPIATPLVEEISRRLDFLLRVGVHYVTLDRSADSLSGGELQRVRLATSIGSGLRGVLYILDEPSIGLHPRDNAQIIDAVRDLCDRGNTVLVVEHDEAVMRAADRLIDMGPGAGDRGGAVVAQGTPDEVAADVGSITGAYLSGGKRIDVPAKRRRTAKSRMLEVAGATHHNLKSVDAAFPLQTLTCVTGVSGSGKSSLVIDTLAAALAQKLNGAGGKPGPYTALRGAAKLKRVVHVDQSPIGRTPRSNPATYTGVFDEVRKIFAATKHAKQLGYKLGRFSFNTKGGRCEACQGQGVQRVEMRFLPDLFVTCPTCHGKQFNRQTLAVRYRGKSIADVLAMSIDEAAEFFASHDGIHQMLTSLAGVGLGYLTLGQRSNTLSGGEAQRVKLATELGRPGGGPTLFVLDEPTTGLHVDDVGRLLTVLHQLVDLGNTVVVIEHNLDVIKTADWVLDLGPEGGDAGGEIIAAGTPETVAASEASHTGRFLRGVL